MGCDRARRAALQSLTGCFVAAAASGIALAHGADGEGLNCANPGALSAADLQQRKLDNYTEQSPDPAKTCSGCRFFTAGGEAASCGMCAIFNGPANPQGRCDDWAARPV